jgi:hypothetical protein
LTSTAPNAGLLSAAQYHGAAHQKPQEFQVCLERARRPLVRGRVRVAFVVRKRLRDVHQRSGCLLCKPHKDERRPKFLRLKGLKAPRRLQHA